MDTKNKKKMKNNFFNLFIAVTVVFMSSAMVSCGSSKQASSSQSSVDDEIAKIERETKLLQAKTNLEVAKREADLRLSQTHQVNITLEWTPCNQQSLVASGGKTDVLTGLGISDQQRDRTEALLNANNVAVAEIASRFIGVIKNGLERYSEQGYTQSGARLDQSSLEGLASSIGEKAINKIAHPVCREVATDNKTGMYVGYVAVHAPLKDAIDETEKEFEKMKLNYDKKKFRDYVNSELEGQNKQRLEEMEALEASRR